MIVLRGVSVFIFSALLAGCFAPVCPAPGKPLGGEVYPCYYKLQIVAVDRGTGLVKTKYPSNLMGEGQEFEGATTKVFEPFFVRDLDKPRLEVDHVYMFASGGGPSLEAFQEGDDFPKDLTEKRPFLRIFRWLIP
jgi:hypothetical protein